MTTYYIDFDNGNDSTNDGTTPVKGNGDGPWATLDKAATTLTAGDKAIVRRGMTQAVSQDCSGANDGTKLSPIILEADYDDDWGDFVDLSGTETATLTWGSKVVTFSGDISGVLSAGDWIYVSGDDARLYAYEVASISGGSNEVANLYLPYKGGQAGSGKTVYNMGANPIWNTAAGNYQMKLLAAEWWILRGLHLRGTDSQGQLFIYNHQGVICHDCILEGNGAADVGFRQSGGGLTHINKCRIYNNENSFLITAFSVLRIKDCYVDGNSIASSCLIDNLAGVCTIEDTEAVGLVNVIGNVGGQPTRDLILRNVTLTYSGAVTEALSGDELQEFLIEDFDGVLGDARIYGSASADSDTPFIQIETTTVHGSEASSIKVTPGDYLTDDHELGKILIFEIPIQSTTDSKTYTVYFKSSATGNWTADPTAAELWIEAECWESGSTIRGITKSTGTCDFNGDDTNWLELTVTVAPSAAGIVWLRCWYCKPKESGKSNIFYVSPLPGIA